MLILAFETSAKAASAALLQDNVLLAETYQNTGLTHSQTLLPMAEALLKNCGFTPEDVEAVAVAAGPGSFTGIRIGVAAAKGFAWGKEIPCCGVSTLEAMALQFGASDGYILPVMDARRDQVYTALFYAEKGVCRRILEDRAVSFAELQAELQKLNETIYLVGDGSRVCYDALHDQIPALVIPPEHRMHQRACGVGLAAYEKLKSGENCSGAELTPNYLRLSQAERERLAKQEI